MNENTREVQLKATMDATGVRAGVEQAKTALGDLGKAAEREGAKAGAGIGQVGEGAEKASTKVEREVGRMAQAIQRATAAAEAGGRGTAAYFEAIAKQRGISGDALGPYLAQLRQAEAAQNAATAGLGNMGMSAKATAAALRQVPAQFTDIATSLAAGQAPLTVFLQQGGQLKDAFGGAGAAAKALGGYVLGLINPFTIAAAAGAALALAYNQGANEAQAFTRALVLSGNQAGLTARSLQDMARAQSAIVGTQGEAAEALAKLAGTGRVSALAIESAAEAVVRFGRVGGSVDDTVKKFERLGKEPLKAVVDLNEAENFLTVAVYKQIKALEDQGRVTEAASLAQQTYAAALNGRAKQIEQSLGSIERGWFIVKDAAKAAWDAMLNVGRPQSTAALDQQIASLERQQQVLSQGNAAQKTQALLIGEQVTALKQQRDAVSEVEREQKKAAAAAQTRNVETDKAIRADKDAEKGAKAINSELEKQRKLVAELAGLSGDFFEEWARLPKIYKNVEQLTEAQAKLLAKQPAIRDAAKAEADARKAAAKSLDDLVKAEQRRLDAQYKVAEQVGEQIQKLQDEEAAIGVAAAQNISLAAAIEKVRAARLEEAVAKATAAQDYSTAAAIRAEIEAREKLAAAINSKDSRDAAKKGAEAATKEWERASNEIERTITDALMRGFESGKGFVQTLRDTLVNTFKTLVLRPTIQALVQPLAVGLLGTGAGAAAAGTAGGALNAASGLGTAGGLLGLFGAGGLSGALMGGAGWLTGATTLGGSLGAAGSLIGTGTLSGATSGLAMGIGAIAPIAGAAALVANALGLFRSTEYKGTSIRGTLGMGDLSDYAVTRRSGSLFSGPKWSENFAGTNAASDAIQAAFSSVREATAAMAEQLGISGTAIRQFTQALYIDGNGKSAEQVQKELSDALNGANDSLARFALGTNAYAKAGETASQTLERLAGSLTGVNGVLGALGQSLLTIGVAGGDTASQLLGLFGGLQQFQQAGAQYLDAYYTEAEKTALATQQLTTQLSAVGLAVPATREAYRALVETQDLNTEAGRKAYAALLQLSPAFASLVPATDALADASAETAAAVQRAAEQMAEAGRRALAGLADQQAELQVELLRAQGQVAAAVELERSNALAKLTEGLSATDSAAATAAFDFNAALRQQIDALKAAAAAAEQAAQAEAQRAAAIANERAGLEQRLMQQQGDTAGLRALELQALDASNRSILERIFALQDQQAAEQESARIMQEAARAEEQRVAAIAQQRGGLEERLMQLQGDTAALRARELAALDPTNRTLLERIFALQDEQAAAQAAAQAAQDLANKQAAVANERFGLEGQLLQLLGDTAGLRARELAALDPSNRALQEKIYALIDEKEAQQRAAEAAQAAAQAAEQMRAAWQSVTDSLFEEVKRIRGLMSGNGQQSLASAQAQFAITTAQARAGDQEAAKLLPGLSQTLLQLAEANAGSLLDLQRIRAQIAASLEQTGAGFIARFGLTLPKLATGTNYVPRDMAAIVHEGEAIVPRAYNPAAAGGGGRADSAEAVNLLRELLDAIKAGDLSSVKLQTEANRLLRKWDGEGLPETRVTA